MNEQSLPQLARRDWGETICAPATATGLSGITVIRVSGQAAARACDLLFRPGKRFLRPSDMSPYSMAVGAWFDRDGRFIDQVVLSAFRAPHSYTGEDVFEISCHGGAELRRTMMASLLEIGLREASAGEFSKRAFLNGKMDLLQAEAVMDLIAAESEQQLDRAGRELRGSLSRAVGDLSAKLYQLQARVELHLEFPELSDAREAETEIQMVLQDLLAKLRDTLAGWRQGRLLSEGLRVVIAGAPNAGKSTLLNELSGENRAIVHERAGTTRDLVESRVRLGGLTVLLTDTAGLRNADDEIEQEGVRRTHLALGDADLILWLISAQGEMGEIPLWEEQEIEKRVREGCSLILIAGKQDLPGASALKSNLERRFPGQERLSFSKGNAACIGRIRASIGSYYENCGNQATEGILLHNLRHKRLLEQSLEQLKVAESILSQGLPWDILASSLWAAQEGFAEMIGKQVSDELIEEIFSRFCVGK